MLNTLPPPILTGPLRAQDPARHSQAEPLHHALPRLGRGGAGVRSCFHLTGQGVAGGEKGARGQGLAIKEVEIHVIC